MPETGATYRPKANEVIAEADVHQQFDRLVEVADRWLEGMALTFTGLTIHVAAGKVYINGYLVTFASTVNEALASGNNTYYVFAESDADITVNTTGIAPANSIKIWEVVVSGGVISGTTDFRDRTLYLDPPLVAQGGLDADGNEVTNVGTPTNDANAANKGYVDAAVAGVGGIKSPVRAASTGNVNTASPGAALDGVTLVNGNGILLKDQTTPSQNGIYTFNGAASALTRRPDADTAAELLSGTKVAVTEGTVNAGTTWRLSTTGTIVIGTTGLTFTLDSVTGQRGTASGLATLDGTGVHTATERPTATTAAKGDALVGTATPTETADSAGAVGASTTRWAREDHQHAHGNRGGGTLHAAATAGANGFMPAADKAKLDAATGAATPNTLPLRNGAGQASFAEGSNDDHAANVLQVQSLAYNMALLNGGM